MSIPNNVAVIIPAYNEEKHIEEVILRTSKILSRSQIIVVNDGSKDNTRLLAQHTDVTVLHHIVNLGKGAAVNTGCAYAFSNGFDVVVLMDSDGQHEPEDIPRFLDALKGNDIVFGFRQEGNAPFIQRVGNWGLTIMSNILFEMPIKDTQSGFRAFTKQAYTQIKWDSTGYGMESEMISRAQGLRYAQLPIKMIYHDAVKGTTIVHGFKIACAMIQWKLFGGKL